MAEQKGEISNEELSSPEIISDNSKDTVKTHYDPREFKLKSPEQQREIIASLPKSSEGVETAINIIKNLEHDMAGQRDALAAQLESILQTHKLRAELGAKQSSKQLVDEYIKTQKLLHEIMRRLDTGTGDDSSEEYLLRRTRHLIEEQLKNDKELWDAYESEINATDISKVGEAHNAFFIHNFAPGDRSLNAPDIKQTGVQTKEDLRTRLELILGLEPTLSCSTLQRGDDSKNIFWSDSKVGVILKGGVLEDAAVHDMNSVQVGVKQRVRGSAPQDSMLGKRIADALGKRGGQYNEFVVRDPKVAGIFINYDQIEEGDPATRTRQEVASRHESQIEEALVLSEELGLPIYWFQGGKMKRYDKYDRENKTLVPHRQEIIGDSPEYLGLPYRDITESPVNFSNEDKKQMAKSILERNIFNKVPPELIKDLPEQISAT